MTISSTEEDTELKEYFTRFQSLLPTEMLGKVNTTSKSKKKGDHAFSSQESLKQRLQNKINELKSKRKAGVDDTQKIEKQRVFLKKKLKQVNTTLPSTPDSGHKSANTPKSTTDKDTKKNQKKKEFNKDNRILYSKFDLIDRNEDPMVLTEHNKKKLENRRKNRYGELGALTGKNYQKLLRMNQAKTAELKALSETDPEKARAIKEKDRWNTALLKAEGVKVKDDIQLLKKAAKRQEKSKKASKKRWEDRIATVQKGKDQRQLKRKENLGLRSDAKKKKKLDRAAKKGRYIPELNNHQ